jgi:hypothetical protein
MSHPVGFDVGCWMLDATPLEARCWLGLSDYISVYELRAIQLCRQINRMEGRIKWAIAHENFKLTFHGVKSSDISLTDSFMLELRTALRAHNGNE